mgnify:CR=1 FL=1
MPEDENRRLSSIPQLKRQAVDIARNGTCAEAAAMILGLCRQARRECRGQMPGVPDLSVHKGQMAEGALLYEYLPELASRLLKASGVEMLRTADERDIPDLDHFSDADLRLAIGDCMRSSRFPAIGSSLRQLSGLNAFACEILAGDPHEGNPVEITTSRMIPALDADQPGYRRDYLEIDREHAARGLDEELEEHAPSLGV